MELLHSSSKLDSPLPGSLHVELSSFRVIVHHLKELVLFETKGDAKLVKVSITCFVMDLRLKVVQDLVVSKVAVSW
jgi:hypothetical protein